MENQKPGKEKKKTTRDEGKTFNKVTAFVCVQDCYLDGKRWRPGEEDKGKTCPPYFEVKPEPDDPGEAEKKET
jgi:hypothetical protein